MNVRSVGNLQDAQDGRLEHTTIVNERTRELCEFRDRATTRKLFVSWRILEIMEQRIVPASAMVDRLSKLLERDVTTDEWWEWVAHGVHETDVVRALARVLRADPDWLADGMI